MRAEMRAELSGVSNRLSQLDNAIAAGLPRPSPPTQSTTGISEIIYLIYYLYSDK